MIPPLKTKFRRMENFAWRFRFIFLYVFIFKQRRFLTIVFSPCPSFKLLNLFVFLFYSRVKKWERGKQIYLVLRKMTKNVATEPIALEWRRLAQSWENSLVGKIRSTVRPRHIVTLTCPSRTSLNLVKTCFPHQVVL